MFPQKSEPQIYVYESAFLNFWNEYLTKINDLIN